MLELEQNILINKKEKEFEFEEIVREKNILKEKLQEKMEIENKISDIENLVTIESGQIISIKNLLLLKIKKITY